MKVLVNAFSARQGGGRTYLVNLLRWVPDEPKLKILIYAPHDLELPPHPSVERMRTRWPTSNPIFRAVWEAVYLPKVLRRERIDVLFCPGGLLSPRIPFGCLKVTMFRNMIPFDPRVRRSIPLGLQSIRNWLLRRLMLESLSNADLSIFVSNGARAVIESLIRVPNAITIPHGVSDSFRTSERTITRPAWLPNGPYILYVSRLDVYKHHKEVLAAFANLPSAHRRDLSLVFVGDKKTPYGRAVGRSVVEMGLDNSVHLVGEMPYADLPAAYRNAEVIVFASSCENCPNILLEALGSGRPVLCSSVPPMPEFGGDAVLYFSPFDPEDITSKLFSVLADRRYATRLGQAAAARCLGFDWGSSARATWQALLELPMSTLSANSSADLGRTPT